MFGDWEIAGAASKLYFTIFLNIFISPVTKMSLEQLKIHLLLIKGKIETLFYIY